VREDVERRVAEVAEEVLGASSGRLQADSLATAELILALEERLGVRLPEDVALGTVEDAARAVVVAPSAGGASGRLRDGFGRLQWVAHATFGPPLRGIYRLDVAGTEHVPASGPAVLASNHDSLLDIPALVVASPRPVWFMAKVELFRGRAASSLLHRMGGFPVRREALGMYPEGTRASHLGPFLCGAAWLALVSGAPLVPVGISGTAEAMPKGVRLPRRTRVVVRFGQPMEPGFEDDPRARLERARGITDDLRSEVERLLA
jgi:1-acyl-sn-glycerol-3-phosphate acyltransferase